MMVGKLRIARRRLPNGFTLHVYEFRDFKWIVEVKRAPEAFYDHLLAQHFQGTYLEFAQLVVRAGERDEDLRGSYLYGPISYTGKAPRYWGDTPIRAWVALDPPLVGGDDIFVELVVSVNGEDYLVSASPDAPVGLLARLDHIANARRRWGGG